MALVINDRVKETSTTQGTPIPGPLHLQFPVPMPWASLGERAIHAAGVSVKIRALFRRLMPKRPLDPGTADAGHPPYAPRSWEATTRASGSEIWGCLGTPVPS